MRSVFSTMCNDGEGRVVGARVLYDTAQASAPLVSRGELALADRRLALLFETPRKASGRRGSSQSCPSCTFLIALDQNSACRLCAHPRHREVLRARAPSRAPSEPAALLRPLIKLCTRPRPSRWQARRRHDDVGLAWRRLHSPRALVASPPATIWFESSISRFGRTKRFDARRPADADAPILMRTHVFPPARMISRQGSKCGASLRTLCA